MPRDWANRLKGRQIKREGNIPRRQHAKEFSKGEAQERLSHTGVPRTVCLLIEWTGGGGGWGGGGGVGVGGGLCEPRSGKTARKRRWCDSKPIRGGKVLGFVVFGGVFFLNQKKKKKKKNTPHKQKQKKHQKKKGGMFSAELEHPWQSRRTLTHQLLSQNSSFLGKRVSIRGGPVI